MGFFDEAKHKIEEVVGKAEQTVGGAFGNTAMEVSGEAHAEHGEALREEDEARRVRPVNDENPQDNQNLTSDDATQADAAVLAEREKERRLAEAEQKIQEAKAAQNDIADTGEPMRRADS